MQILTQLVYNPASHAKESNPSIVWRGHICICIPERKYLNKVM